MFDNSLLSSWATDNSNKIASKAIAGSAFAKLLIDNGAVQSGVTGTSAILKLDSVVVLQDSSSCSRSPMGSTVLGAGMITVKPIKVSENLCAK